MRAILDSVEGRISQYCCASFGDQFTIVRESHCGAVSHFERDLPPWQQGLTPPFRNSSTMTLSFSTTFAAPDGLLLTFSNSN